MQIGNNKYDDTLVNYLQQAQIALNNLLISKDGSVFGWSDYEKFYIQLIYFNKDNRCELCSNCKDENVNSLIWKCFSDHINIIKLKLQEEKSELEVLSEIKFKDKLEFYVFLTELGVKANEE